MTVTVYPAGREPEVFKPGTLLACHGNSLISDSIRFGQRLRIEKEYCWANHIACVLTTSGTLMEMLSEGATLTHAREKYRPQDYVIIDPGLAPDDAQRACEVWRAIYKAHIEYGFLEIASIVASLLAGFHLRFFTQGKLICSGAATVGLAATQADIPLWWREDPGFVLPAHLMRHWKVSPPKTKGS